MKVAIKRLAAIVLFIRGGYFKCGSEGEAFRTVVCKKLHALFWPISADMFD